MNIDTLPGAERSKTIEPRREPGAMSRLPLEPMDPQLTSIQPGGGWIVRVELAWGRLRRWYLMTFRPRYLVRMRAKRRGEFNGCPHDVLDPRDVKFYQNQGGYFWKPQDDPFTWRDRLPFARVGLAELIVIGGGAIAVAILLLLIAVRAPLPLRFAVIFGVLAAAFALVGAFVISFFRDPRREIPIGAGLVVSPADGTILNVAEISDDEFIGRPAIKISIFLSIFNVHINRMPVPARVIGLRYRRGKMLDARRPESAEQNEQLAVRIESEAPPYRRMVVRQITGLIARRIVCWLKPGDVLAAGERFGMIKFGSRTELVLPCETGLEITVKKGDKVQAGSTILARYRDSLAVGETS
jgi:phosphatidylserine decarboxylase